MKQLKTNYLSIIFLSGLLCLPLIFYFGWVMLRHVQTVKNVSQRISKPSQSFPQAEIVWPKRIPILMYHYVEYVQDKGDTIRQSLDITPYTFEKQLETLVNAGYTFMTASELSEVFDGTKELPVKPIILTFDDGYRDFYTDAYPILLKYRAKATVYVISGFIGFKNYMTKEQIREIAQNRLVEIGSHTVHHVSLKFAPIEEVQKELIESKNELSVLTGLPVISFAYPNGSYDDKAVNAVKEVGFKTAVATKPGVELDPGMRYFLVRIRTGGLSGKELLNRLNQKTISMY